MRELKVKIPEEVMREMEETKGSKYLEEKVGELIEFKALETKFERSRKLELALLKALTSESTLSEEEAEKFSLELGRVIKKNRYKELKELSS